jgi:hypothetical protein
MGNFIMNLSAYTSPEIVETRNKEWVEYGSDNNYFQYLIDRYTGSTTNNAIINGVSKMIYGKGLSATNSNKKPEQYAQMLSLFKKNDLRRFVSDRKLLGMAAFQVSYNKGLVSKVSHFPMETLRPEKANKDGVIEAWYYHPNWTKKKPSEKPTRIVSFGLGSNKENEIYVLKPYVAGYYYFSPVDYQGALPYAVLEEEIGDYLINDTLNGFSGTKVINFNNGIPDEEKQKEIKNQVLKKLTGTKGEKVIVAFNSNAENKTTVEDLPLNDAPAHYQYLSDECTNKLIVGHRVTSPLLIGVKTGNSGLGNNAEEIKTANLLFDNIVINTYQEEVTDVIDEILAVNDISLNTYFITVQPLEFIDTEGLDKETKEEETGVKMSKDDLSDEQFEEIENSLEGESIDDEWELVEKREYDEEAEDVESWANRLVKEKKTALQKLAGFVKSAPNKESYLDKSYYKIRYEYAEKYSSAETREFCKNMMARTANGVVYRKEDIAKASFSGVNKSFGHKGQNYSLFRFKGGVNCGHFFNENLYRFKSKTEKYISKGKEVNTIPASYTPKGKEYREAKIAPKDMPNNGHHPNYKG